MGVSVFVAGATGYIGRELICKLLQNSHTIRGLFRQQSDSRLPSGCVPVPGNALNAASYARGIAPSNTFVHLVGTSHPAPWKERQFREIDLASVREALSAAKAANIRQFVYVSVAQPAPVMKAYIRVRSECEAIIRQSGIAATFVRPWYVLGPGHYWPYALKPFYWIAEQIPVLATGAHRLGLVTLQEMVDALVYAIEHPASAERIIDVAAIRELSRDARTRRRVPLEENELTVRTSN